jgi:hypothetical protein
VPVLPATGGTVGSFHPTSNNSSAVVVLLAVPGPVMFWRMPSTIGPAKSIGICVPTGTRRSCTTARDRSTKPGCVGDVGVLGS